MKQYKKEIIKLTAKEILLSFFDLAMPFYENDRKFRLSARRYMQQRAYERSQFFEKISYLKKRGYIETFVESKERYVELTSKGVERAKILKFESIQIVRPGVWDGSWRIIIFDIPNKKKTNREMFRRRLIKLGFEKIQESVYAYPFECTNEITIIASALSVIDDAIIMVAEVIQGEENIIQNFLDKNILTKQDLVRQRK